jgi:hypothetical protein
MPNVSSRAVVRDVLAEVDELQTSLVLRAAAKEAIRQMGHGKLKEHARRIATAYIDAMDKLPFGGAVVKQVALPALDKFVDDFLAGLEGQ